MIEERLIDDIKARVDLVALVGAIVSLKRSGKDFVGKCPFHDDHSPSFYVVPSKGFWHCFPCGAQGDAVEWLVRTMGLSFPEAVAELGNRVGIAVENVEPRPRRAWTPPPPKPEPEPVRLPVDDVDAYFAACVRLEDARSDDPAIPWLRDWRALDVGFMGLQDLARLTPRTGSHPWWLPRLGMDLRPWATLYRLAVPLYDATGDLRALRFRAVDRVWNGAGWDLREVASGKKSLMSASTGVRGLVVADALGRALLRGETTHDGATWNGIVVLAEGEPDAWTWATTARKARWQQEANNTGSTWATFGYVQGAWTRALADRIPDGATVIIRRHIDDNAAGNRMARSILETFEPRRRDRRVRVLWRGGHVQAA